MPRTPDPRLAELKVLENLAERNWPNGICASDSAGQAAAVGMSQRMYADLLLTLFEDGLLYTEADGLKRQLKIYETERGIGFRNQTVIWLAVSSVFCDVTVTYRGLRRMEELRDQLRRDRILERFGILLDGRYITSDLIYFLERANGEPVSLILADVDDFKRFNTEHGYKAGDEILRQVFRITRAVVANRGDVYRRGGEEIVALLPYCPLDSCHDIAERARREIEETPIRYEGEMLNTTLSLGIACSPPCDPDGPGLETNAEIALRRAKGEGKNRTIIYQPQECD